MKNRGGEAADAIIQILTVEKYYKKFINAFDSLPEADRDALIKAIEEIEGYDEEDDEDDTFVHACFGSSKVARGNAAKADSAWNQINGDQKPKVIEVITKYPKLAAFIC